MPETEQPPEEEDVEGHGYVRPRPGDTIGPPLDPSQADEEEDVEAHGYVRPRPGDTIGPPLDPS